jgi:hypothetical protein
MSLNLVPMAMLRVDFTGNACGSWVLLIRESTTEEKSLLYELGRNQLS